MRPHTQRGALSVDNAAPDLRSRDERPAHRITVRHLQTAMGGIEQNAQAEVLIRGDAIVWSDSSGNGHRCSVHAVAHTQVRHSSAARWPAHAASSRSPHRSTPANAAAAVRLWYVPGRDRTASQATRLPSPRAPSTRQQHPPTSSCATAVGPQCTGGRDNVACRGGSSFLETREPGYIISRFNIQSWHGFRP